MHFFLCYNNAMIRLLKIAGLFIAFMVGMFFIGFIISNYIVMPIYVKSSREVEVPDVCGLEFEEAKQLLAENRLSGEFEVERFSEGIPPGIVVSQRPAPGKIVKQGKKVFLTVSKGEESVRIPYVIGLDINQANNILLSSGLFLGEITHKNSPSKENTIISTDPPAESILPRGSRVNLVLSKGPLSFNIPDLTGYTLENAKKKITRLGLELGEVTYTTNSPLCNTVILQSPIAGEEVKQGDKVNLILGE